MAPPAVQGIAQQLVLDRRVGSYQVPDGWFVWAAGNRRDDRAAVFDMPAPLANRFLHYDVEVDPEGFLRYAARNDLSAEVIAFIGFRPQLLHKVDRDRPAWPSPRTWEMASRLRRAGLSIESAVGQAAADEFAAFQLLYRELPDLGAILAGTLEGAAFPEEPSRRYAITLGLASRAANGDEAAAAMRWLARGAPHEWTRLFVGQVLERMRGLGQTDRFVSLAARDAALVRFLQDYRALVDGG
jgi:MoxR-like ATPase